MRQKDLAKMICADEMTIVNWEKRESLSSTEQGQAGKAAQMLGAKPRLR